MYAIDISKPITCAMAGRVCQRNGWEHNGTIQTESNIFVFVLDGESLFHLGGKSYRLYPGDVILIPKNLFYTAHTDSFCEYYFFHFSGDIKEKEAPLYPTPAVRSFSFFLEELNYDLLYLEPLTHTAEHFDSVLLSVLAALEYNISGTQYGRRMLDHTFTSILYFLASLSESRAERTKYPSLVSNLIFHVKKNLSQRITVSDCCRKQNVSPSYVARVFKKHLGISLSEYINQEKMHYAKELLLRSSMNISEISDYLGYCDVFYFSKLFKRTFGFSPRDFRKGKRV